MAKYLRNNAGRITEESGVTISAGAADVGKLTQLDATGRLDTTVLPVGIGADTALIQTSEALAAGDFVNVHNVSGSARVRKADAASSGKEATGFVLSAVASGTNAMVYFEGQNGQLTGRTPGARQYLSAITPGAVVEAAPSAAGQVLQFLGVAVSATSVTTEIEDGIILA